jgi:hypothetical protein
MFSIIDLAGRSPDKLDSGEIQLIKDFIIGASRNINNKMLAIEKKYNVNIKLAPLPKKVVNVSNPLTSFPMMTTAHVNTGLHGSFRYPTTVDINLPFLFDSISGMGGENYKQRLNKMLEYIKIYKIVKTQLEAYALTITPASTPVDIKNARAKVSSQYVEFLPDTPDDIKNIDQFEDPDLTEDEIETAAKFFLNPKSTVSSIVPTVAKPATPVTTTGAATVSTAAKAPALTTTAKPSIRFVPAPPSPPAPPAPPSPPKPTSSTTTTTAPILLPSQIKTFNQNLLKIGLEIDKDLNINRLPSFVAPKLAPSTKYTDNEVKLINILLNTINYEINNKGILTKLGVNIPTGLLKKTSDVDTSIAFSSDEEVLVDEITELNNKYNRLMKTTDLYNKEATPLPIDKQKEFTNLMNEYQKLVNKGKLSASDTKNAQLIISRLNNAITTKNFMLGGRRTYY